MSGIGSIPRTEALVEGTIGLDQRGNSDILTILLVGQQRALNSVTSAIPGLSAAADLVADALGTGGRLLYVAAGSPALMSLADALELPITYGISHDRVVLALAEGNDIGRQLDGSREDDADAARATLRHLKVGPGDCVVATSASGSTAYTVAGLAAAKAAGARTVAIAGNAGAPLFIHADVAILLDTGPEVISGSTRMGAGTAQKVALNMLSTLANIRLGHVHDGLMINFKVDNEKLRGRAARIVTTITGASADAAAHALRTSDGEIKPAILVAAGAKSLADAVDLLGETKGNVRRALSQIRSTLHAR